MFAWDRLHLCCQMSDGIIDHVCDCALKGISEYFGDRLGSTVAGLFLLSNKTAHQRTNLHAVMCIVRCGYCGLSEEFGMCFVVTGPQCALHSNCMVGKGLDIVGQISAPWS